MKHITILLVAAALCAAAVSCAGRGGETKAAGQVIRLTDELLRSGGSDTLRFGRLYEGETAVRRITLYNETQEPTVIVTHEASCGCVTLDYERRPIMPGESADAEFTFDSRGEAGWQMKLITLRLGATGTPLKIYVEAEVE